jgi:hypothetical protein
MQRYNNSSDQKLVPVRDQLTKIGVTCTLPFMCIIYEEIL